jgi:hypothetical protein
MTPGTLLACLEALERVVASADARVGKADIVRWISSVYRSSSMSIQGALSMGESRAGAACASA